MFQFRHELQSVTVNKQDTIYNVLMDDLSPTECEQKFITLIQKGEIIQKDFIEYGIISIADSVNPIKGILPFLFKDPLDLVNKKNPYNYSILEQALRWQKPQIFQCLLEYGGCFNLLSQLSEENFNFFLKDSPEYLLNFVLEKSPEIFSYQDEHKDFLKLSIDHKKFQNIEFVKKNLKALKETYDDIGVPLIFSAHDLSTLMQVMQEDRSILELKTKDGITAFDLFKSFVTEEDPAYEQLSNLFKKSEENK